MSRSSLKCARLLARREPRRICSVSEITESAALGDPDRALALLEECKAAGLLVLLDHFGTHYSSLTYLKKFRSTSSKSTKRSSTAYRRIPTIAVSSKPSSRSAIP